MAAGDAGDDASSRESKQALLRALARTADARRLHGRHAEAGRLYQRALAIAEDAFGVRHHEVATILHNLAIVMEAEGRDDEAEPLLHRAWRLREDLLGPGHPDTTTTITRLAEVRKRMGCDT